jgi:type I restriction enzyme S subunit
VNYELITSTEEYITKSGLDNSSARLANEGTLLMAMYGQGVTRGRVAILGIKAAYNQACAAISLNERLNNEYTQYFFITVYDFIRDTGNETSQMNLSSGIISKIKVLLPPIKEQLEIVGYLKQQTEKLEFLKTEAKRGIELLQERRTALISAAVTGKIDVRGLVSKALPEEAAA